MAINKTNFRQFIYDISVIIIGVLFAVWISNIDSCAKKKRKIQDYKNLVLVELVANEGKVVEDIKRINKEIEYCDSLKVKKNLPNLADNFGLLTTIPNFDCSHSCLKLFTRSGVLQDREEHELLHQIVKLEENFDEIEKRDQFHFKYLENYLFNDLIRDIPHSQYRSVIKYLESHETQIKIRLLGSSLKTNLEIYEKYLKDLLILREMLVKIE